MNPSKHGSSEILGAANERRRTSSIRPWVFLNMAMTADGKIANANREISSFGSERDFEHLLELRATADAVMAGARTVDSDAVNLGPGPTRFRRTRRALGLREYNVRIVVSGSGTINPRAEIFRHRFSPIIILTSSRAKPARLRQLRSVADEVRIFGELEVDLRAALRWLHQKWQVNRLLVEGGGELNAALFRAGLIDEVNLTVCPKIFGGVNSPTIAEGVGVAHLADAIQLDLKSLRRVGDELFLVYTVAHPKSPSASAAKRHRK